jgi:hypothetical protein
VVRAGSRNRSRRRVRVRVGGRVQTGRSGDGMSTGGVGVRSRKSVVIPSSRSVVSNVIRKHSSGQDRLRVTLTPSVVSRRSMDGRGRAGGSGGRSGIMVSLVRRVGRLVASNEVLGLFNKALLLGLGRVVSRGRGQVLVLSVVSVLVGMNRRGGAGRSNDRASRSNSSPNLPLLGSARGGVGSDGHGLIPDSRVGRPGSSCKTSSTGSGETSGSQSTSSEPGMRARTDVVGRGGSSSGGRGRGAQVVRHGQIPRFGTDRVGRISDGVRRSSVVQSSSGGGVVGRSGSGGSGVRVGLGVRPGRSGEDVVHVTGGV